jgi:hypothetical protein
MLFVLLASKLWHAIVWIFNNSVGISLQKEVRVCEKGILWRQAA